MPRKAQGWITFQSSEEERQILEQICQQTQRTKTEVLREMLRNVGRSLPPASSQEVEEGEEGEEALPAGERPTLQGMRISARNILQAKVKHIVKGKVNAEVILTIAPGVELVSIVTRSSADSLGLRKGKSVMAVIKSNNVMIADAEK